MSCAHSSECFSACILTVAAAYVHDSTAGASGMEPDASHMIVNWDVAARKWVDIKDTAHAAWSKLRSVTSTSSI
jgi:hypothetical protein